MYAAQNIVSTNRKIDRPYALKGDKLRVIQQHAGVCIVEGPGGFRFSVRTEKLSEKPVASDMAAVEQQLYVYLRSLLQNKGEELFLKTYRYVNTTPEPQFSIKGVKKPLWLKTAALVWHEEFNTDIDG